jgi:transcriptional regulator with XRE-family HTH domain
MAEHQFQKRVGRNIRNQRTAVGMTMKELGEKVGLSESSISKYETGDIKSLDLNLLKKIAAALSCDANDLTKWEDGEHEAYNAGVKAKRLAKHNKLYEQLTFENQKKADEYIRFLISQQKPRKAHKDTDKAN